MKLYKFFRGVFSALVTGQEPVGEQVKTKEWTWTVDCEHKPYVFSGFGLQAVYTDEENNGVTAIVRDGDPIELGVIGHIVEVEVYLMDNKTKRIQRVLAVLTETGPGEIHVGFRTLDHNNPIDPALGHQLEAEVAKSKDKCKKETA